MDIYSEILDTLKINHNDKLYISSNIISFYLYFKQNKIDFSCDAFIDKLQERVGENGLLLFPTFNFDFSNNKKYDIRSSNITTGALSKATLLRKDFKRTKHPMHSFSAWGKDKDYLCNMEYTNSFGKDSIFSYFREHNVDQLILGTDYNHGFTFVHYVENLCNVPYRFNKIFEGEYIDFDGNACIRKYDYPARYLEIEPKEEFNKIGKILEEKGISQIYNYKGIENHRINLADSFEVIKNDILNNKCENIYSFNIDREEVFKDWR